MKMISKRHVVRMEFRKEPGDKWPELFPIGKLTAIKGDTILVEFLDPIHAKAEEGLGFLSMTVWGTKINLRKAGNWDTGRSSSVVYGHGQAPEEVHDLIREMAEHRWNVPAVKSTP